MTSSEVLGTLISEWHLGQRSAAGIRITGQRVEERLIHEDTQVTQELN